ncbi:hypothetical protein BOTBODRAFT_26116 [Botryobasidium botryosum FD-172 SS1]|uniref:DUF1279 domain-containing protein n=1 Tax=Botryobasidium botryosum (strain FD-172 SS1) TaxID=930990 RepID=A0A067NC28_BOTB1|nr:hypothetical protein BOTBODRAFT_26116 [Botryobasidium botryosum FD-172 SS1]
MAGVFKVQLLPLRALAQPAVTMPPGRILRIPFLRPFFPRTPAILPFARPASTASTSASRVLYHPVPTAPFPASSPFRAPRRSYSNSPPPSSNASNASSSGSPPPDPTTFSGRLKVLIKSYGWYALGVYLFFSALDFSFVFATVSFFGAAQVNQATAALRGMISEILHRPAPEIPPAGPGDGSDAPSQNGSESLWAMIVLSYAIHKTLLLPVRVGLTAAFTPRLVRWLTSRGWTGAAGTRRAAEHMRNKVRNRTGRDSD